MPTPVIAFGVKFPSLRDIARSFYLPESTLRYRLKNGFVESEVALICEDRHKFEFVNLDGIAYYKVPWSKDPVNTREIIEHYRPDLLDDYDKSNPTGEYRPYIHGGDI